MIIYNVLSKEEKAVSISIMSWNILCESDFKGVEFSWERRKEYVTSHIKKNVSDSCSQVFCFQEVSLNRDHTQLSDLKRLFSDRYDVFVRRYLKDWGLVVFSDKELDLRYRDHFSDRFLILENKDMCFVNTHFPVSLNDRICVGEWLRSIYDSSDKSFIACGDMNMFPDDGGSRIRSHLCSTGLREVDLYTPQGELAVESFRGYPRDGFYGKLSIRPIDCIFISPEMRASNVVVDDVKKLYVQGEYFGASDHFALTARIWSVRPTNTQR